MAKPFSEVIVELAREDPRIFGVSCDCWGFLSALHREFPNRAVEVGIAEQNLIGVAAGLAMVGKVVFAIGMNPFVTMRCYEQVRTDLGYGEKNVKVIGGYGGGIWYGGWGCTHHAMEEMALMRLIPEMLVLMPADAWETEQAVRHAAAYNGPAYISLNGGQLALGVAEEERVFAVGKAAVLREGTDATIIGVGFSVPDAIAAGEQLAERGIAARVLNMHTMKPLDEAAIRSAAEETRAIVTIEEHTVVGGLGSAVAEVIAEAGISVPFRRIGVRDEFIRTIGSHEQIKERYGINDRAVVECVMELLRQ